MWNAKQTMVNPHLSESEHQFKQIQMDTDGSQTQDKIEYKIYPRRVKE